jgi:hypothetical protein
MKKWWYGVDMEKHDVRNTASELRCMFYMVKAYHDRALDLFVEEKKLLFKMPECVYLVFKHYIEGTITF